MVTKKISGKVAKGAKGKTDWSALKEMSESEIKVRAALDPDAKELSPVELAKMKRNTENNC